MGCGTFRALVWELFRDNFITDGFDQLKLNDEYQFVMILLKKNQLIITRLVTMLLEIKNLV